MRVSPATLILPLALLAAGARAERGIDSEVFRPALDGYGLFTVEGAETPRAWDFGFRLTVDYAQTPLQLRMKDATTGMLPEKALPVIDYQAVIHLGGGLGLTDWLELAAEVPVAAQSYSARYGLPFDDGAGGPTGFFVADARTNIGAPNAAPLDPRVALKARTRRLGPIGLALIVGGTIPFGDHSAFLGDRGFTFRPTGVVDFVAGDFRAMVNVGAIVRSQTLVLDPYDTNLYTTSVGSMAAPRMTASPAGLIAVGSELNLSAAFSYRPYSWGAIGAELFSLVPLVAPDTKSADGKTLRDYVLDGLLGFQFFPGRDVTLNAGAGIGLLDSLRSPAPWSGTHDASDKHAQQFRVFAGVSWMPTGKGGAERASAGDRDHDGIPDAVDRCPDQPEDRDGFQDEDGCPDLDNDEDGIPDKQDKCPNEPEDRDGFQDEDGCPDPDNDNDGIPDAQDLCPDEPEDRDGFEDEDGCPDLDNDQDGIPDAKDRCPNEPETFNGVDDEDGCPDTAGATGSPASRIEIPELIQFDKGKSTVPAAMAPVLDRIAKRLKESGDKRRVRVGGYADDAEAGKRVQQLSLARAMAVRDELIKRGVDGATIEAVGYGVARPLAPNKKAAGRAKNRRVDFTSVEP